MNYFDIGETVVCNIESKKSGIRDDPDSLKITVYKPDGTKAVDNQPMSRDEEGKWHYDVTTTSLGAGIYRATAKATDGSRTIIVNGSFALRG